jgi:hypothetical protein
MTSNLTDQVCSISEVIKTVAPGNLSKTAEVDLQGEFEDGHDQSRFRLAQLFILMNEVMRVSLAEGRRAMHRFAMPISRFQRL